MEGGRDRDRERERERDVLFKPFQGGLAIDGLQCDYRISLPNSGAGLGLGEPICTCTNTNVSL